jgi:hypothetical protein
VWRCRLTAGSHCSHCAHARTASLTQSGLWRSASVIIVYLPAHPFTRPLVTPTHSLSPSLQLAFGVDRRMMVGRCDATATATKKASNSQGETPTPAPVTITPLPTNPSSITVKVAPKKDVSPSRHDRRTSAHILTRDPTLQRRESVRERDLYFHIRNTVSSRIGRLCGFGCQDKDVVKSAPDLMYKYLLNERVILLSGRVDEKMATQAVQVCWFELGPSRSSILFSFPPFFPPTTWVQSETIPPTCIISTDHALSAHAIAHCCGCHTEFAVPR